VSRSLY